MPELIHPGEILAMARRRKALMEGYRRSDEASVLRQYLEDRMTNALKRLMDVDAKDATALLHWRGVWLGLQEALGAPERIIADATSESNAAR